jgi:hypothetical protein
MLSIIVNRSILLFAATGTFSASAAGDQLRRHPANRRHLSFCLLDPIFWYPVLTPSPPQPLFFSVFDPPQIELNASIFFRIHYFHFY